MGMFTDPLHLRISDPGHIEGNVVFTYLDAFCEDGHFAEYLPEYANLDELKEHYRKGGLGDVTIKKFLSSIIEAELAPIRKRRRKYEKDIASVYDILKAGSEAARDIAQKTLDEVKAAMKINYFDDETLIQAHKKKYGNKISGFSN